MDFGFVETVGRRNAGWDMSLGSRPVRAGISMVRLWRTNCWWKDPCVQDRLSEVEESQPHVFETFTAAAGLQFRTTRTNIAQKLPGANGTDEMARYWLHNEFCSRGQEVSKVRLELLYGTGLLEQGVPGEVIRFVMLSTHYASDGLDGRSGDESGEISCANARW